MALAVYASAASAEPLSMTFTEARANVGASQLSDAALFGPPDTAPLEAQISPGGESITAGVLDVPQFNTHITSPIDAEVTVDFDYPTHHRELPLGDRRAQPERGGRRDADIGRQGMHRHDDPGSPHAHELDRGECPRQPTRRSAVHPWAHGGGEWTDMQTAPVGGDTIFCEDVEKAIEGPGGIWLEQAGDVVPPSAPQLTSTDPASPAFSGTPRIRGTAEAGSTVRVYAGAGCTGTPVTTGSAARRPAPERQVRRPETGRQEAVAGEGGAEGCQLRGRSGDETEGQERQKTRSAHRQVNDAFRGDDLGGRRQGQPHARAKAPKSAPLEKWPEH